MHKSSDPQVPEISENEVQKKSEPLLQIQCQNRHMNHDFAGVLELRSDPSQGIAPLADSESTFNVAAFTRFQPFKIKLPLANLRVLRWFAQAWTVEMDAVFFAVPEVVPRPVYGIRKYALGIVPIGFAIGLN